LIDFKSTLLPGLKIVPGAKALEGKTAASKHNGYVEAPSSTIGQPEPQMWVLLAAGSISTSTSISIISIGLSSGRGLTKTLSCIVPLLARADHVCVHGSDSAGPTNEEAAHAYTSQISSISNKHIVHCYAAGHQQAAATAVM
jgi:hypothetical protein